MQTDGNTAAETEVKATKRKTTTSTEVKNRWNAKTYKRYTVQLRKDEDADLIEFVEQNRERYGVTEIFRAGCEAIQNQEG